MLQTTQPEQRTAIVAGLGKRTNYRWVVMGLIFIVWILVTADRANLGVALPYIRKEFNISNTEAGMIISLFGYGYALCQIPIGLLYKKLGINRTRAILPISMLMTSLFTGLMGTTSSPLLLKMFRLGLGISEGPFGVGTLNIMNHWFPPKEKGTAGGLLQASTKFGPVLVPVVCVAITEAFGWREIFYLFAIPGIILSVIWWFMVPNKPSESKFCSPAEVAYIENEQEPEALKTNEAKANKKYTLAWLDKLIRSKKLKPLETVGEVYRSWNIIGTAISFGCMSGISATMMSWIPTYLVTVKGFTSIKMGFLASAPFIGSVLGTTLGGIISDRILDKRRKPTMLLSAIFTTITMYALVYAPNNAFYLGLMLFMTGFMVGIGYPGFSVYPMGVASKEAYPVAFSLVNFVGQIGSATIPLVVGILLDAFNWNAVFIFLTFASLLCFSLISTLDEPVNDTMVPPQNG